MQDNTGIQQMSQKSTSKGAESKIVMEENVIHVEHGISGDRAGSGRRSETAAKERV